jgi:hypothetical protein
MKWITRLFKKEQNKINSLTDLPAFFLQYEYYNSAWSKTHYGYFIDVNGKKYSYLNPDKWRFFSESIKKSNSNYSFNKEKIDYLNCIDLLKNLSKCDCIDLNFSVDISILNKHFLDQIVNSQILDYGDGGCDMGTKSIYLIILNQDTQFYERKLLECTGDTILKIDYIELNAIYDLFKPEKS